MASDNLLGLVGLVALLVLLVVVSILSGKVVACCYLMLFLDIRDI